MCFSSAANTATQSGYNQTLAAMGRSAGTGTAAGSAAASLGSYNAGMPYNFTSNLNPYNTSNVAPADYYSSAAARIPTTVQSPFVTGYKPPAESVATTANLGGISQRVTISPYKKPEGAESIFGGIWNKASEAIKSGIGGKTITTPDGKTVTQPPEWIAPVANMLLSAAIPSPKSTVPSGEEVLAKYQNRQITPEGQAARSKVLEYINNPSAIGGTATTDYIKSIEDQYAQQEADHMSWYASKLEASGYNRFGSDFQRAMADEKRRVELAHNQEVSGIKADLYNKQVDQQLQYIAGAYDIDYKMLQELMNLDITSAAEKYQMKVKEVDDFRQAIQDLIVATWPTAQA